MTTVQEICDRLDAFAPPRLAEDWDNTGLLLGDPAGEVRRVMTCLTLTPNSVAEAVANGANVVISHHPLPFRPIKQITPATTEGELLWRLASSGVSVYSPHTAFDSAPRGINAALAEGLGLKNPRPLLEDQEDPSVGAGRVGELNAAAPLDAFATSVKQLLGAECVRVVGASSLSVSTVATACGSGGAFLDAALAAGADALVTGEATFHTCLAAQSQDLALILPGHYASERFALEQLADWLTQELPDLTIWASREEADPLRSV